MASESGNRFVRIVAGIPPVTSSTSLSVSTARAALRAHAGLHGRSRFRCESAVARGSTGFRRARCCFRLVAVVPLDAAGAQANPRADAGADIDAIVAPRRIPPTNLYRSSSNRLPIRHRAERAIACEKRRFRSGPAEGLRKVRSRAPLWPGCGRPERVQMRRRDPHKTPAIRVCVAYAESPRMARRSRTTKLRDLSSVQPRDRVKCRPRPLR